MKRDRVMSLWTYIGWKMILVCVVCNIVNNRAELYNGSQEYILETFTCVAYSEYVLLNEQPDVEFCIDVKKWK